MKQNYLLCGKVLNTHGVRGALKIDFYCDSAEVFAAIPTLYLKKGNDMIPYTVRRSVRFGRMMLTELDGIDSLDSAFPFKNCELFARRKDIPLQSGSVFLADLIDLPVIDANSGRVYGKVLDIRESPAANLYVIDTENGEVLLPDVPAFIQRADADEGIFITPIEGFFS